MKYLLIYPKKSFQKNFFVLVKASLKGLFYPPYSWDIHITKDSRLTQDFNGVRDLQGFPGR